MDRNSETNMSNRSLRPKVTIQIPPRTNYVPQAYQQQPPSPFMMTGGTTAPSQLGQPPNWPYANPFLANMQAQKAGDFVFKQFEGFKGFSKTGFSFGERCVVWLYAKIRGWSQKWFTHFFLFFMVFLYSVAGALIFQIVEGKLFLRTFKQYFVILCYAYKKRKHQQHMKINLNPTHTYNSMLLSFLYFM